ncbi:transcription termination factor MTERF9, chloroplastic [Magnolia sinica]|uniref:transcription termination factor MTERF9, chloroplastic n=1 Tax=Magnolia sinica TaxID=86752 RepID=UPI00265B425B|nr:transcription termination factor MTERF9, chloroplastic [Magnolia sinica]
MKREMIAKASALRFLHFIVPTLSDSIFIPSSICKAFTLASPTFSSKALEVVAGVEKVVGNDAPKDTVDIFRRCGCNDIEISKILLRQPSLLRVNLPLLQGKLNILQSLGIVGSDLIKIITCRPRFLACRLNKGLDHRLQFLETLFESRQMLRKAIIRNPSLLNYDVDNRMKPCVALYEEMGINRLELGFMLNSRPMIIPRSSLNKEKLAYIQSTGLSKESKMYKYVVSLIAVSRLETIREKVANFEKFGFSFDDVMHLFARTPNVLTLSIHKVQRNMTYIMGTMKLPARIVLDQPFLLYANLEGVLRPRFLLAGKIQEMGLQPQIKGPAMVTAMRMAKPRFQKAFITCHENDIAKSLMEFYSKTKSIKRLAQDSKLGLRKGFPF